MIRVFILMILFLSGCTKYVDATYISSSTGKRIVIARFPIEDNDSKASRAKNACDQFVTIKDATCSFMGEDVRCKKGPETQGSAHCFMDGNPVINE